MVTVPTAGDIRLARARADHEWWKVVDIAQGPLLALLGLGGVTSRVVLGPFLPMSRHVGLAGLADILNAAAAPQEPGDDPTDPALPVDFTREVGQADERPPAHLRAGVYGELAGRGWHMLREFQEQPGVDRAMAEIKTATSQWASTIEAFVDELHDVSEEVAGRALTGGERRALTGSDRGDGDTLAQ